MNYFCRMQKLRLPAEWEPQDAIQIAFPSPDSDWKNYWEEVIPCYVNIIRVLSSYQPLIIVCEDAEEVKSYLEELDTSNILFAEVPINDTWARDHGAIAVETPQGFRICDFTFNGWGNKFLADKDDRITQQLFEKGIYRSYDLQKIDLVLEGGSIESDGRGTLLTTTHCLLSPERNPHLSQQQIEEKLKEIFGLQRVLWLQHGHLEGDDTDAHIDTLARLCDHQTIAYVQCTDTQEPHYAELKKMEEELLQLQTIEGEAYRLVPLPMADAIYAPDDGRRLPATYANFLILNDVVLVPTYGVKQDPEAIRQLQQAFPLKNVVGIDCKPLLLQHGSLHCITMQYPKGSIDLSLFGKTI